MFKCSVCGERIPDSSHELYHCVSCKAVFHYECIKRHILREKICPVCSRKLNLFYIRKGKPPEGLEFQRKPEVGLERGLIPQEIVDVAGEEIPLFVLPQRIERKVVIQRKDKHLPTFEVREKPKPKRRIPKVRIERKLPFRLNLRLVAIAITSLILLIPVGLYFSGREESIPLSSFKEFFEDLFPSQKIPQEETPQVPEKEPETEPETQIPTETEKEPEKGTSWFEWYSSYLSTYKIGTSFTYEIKRHGEESTLTQTLKYEVSGRQNISGNEYFIVQAIHEIQIQGLQNPSKVVAKKWMSADGECLKAQEILGGKSKIVPCGPILTGLGYFDLTEIPILLSDAKILGTEQVETPLGTFTCNKALKETEYGLITIWFKEGMPFVKLNVEKDGKLVLEYLLQSYSS